MWMPLPLATLGNTQMFMAINKANWDIIKNTLWKEIKLFKSK